MPRHDPLDIARRPALALQRVALAAAVLLGACADPEPAVAPQRLADTGLYAEFAQRRIAEGVLPFSPQYPLWTDGAAKRRWIALPAGAAIDASDPDHWRFPVGTRLWKQFDFGRPVETRFMQLQADGRWLYATYRWSDDGSDAVLAPECGVRNAAATHGGAHHDLPSTADCRACHESTRTPVLGFTALQLSPDRDPLAPHAEHAAGDVDLDALLQRGLLLGLPPRWLETLPRVAARTPRERAAVGYLLGNCSSCHNATGPLQRLGLRFDHPLDAAVPPAIATALDVASGFVLPDARVRLAAGAPEQSVLVRRVAASDRLVQMPPFGRHRVDADALALLEAWVAEDLPRAVHGRH